MSTLNPLTTRTHEFCVRSPRFRGLSQEKVEPLVFHPREYDFDYEFTPKVRYFQPKDNPNVGLVYVDYTNCRKDMLYEVVGYGLTRFHHLVLSHNSGNDDLRIRFTRRRLEEFIRDGWEVTRILSKPQLSLSHTIA